MFKLWPYLVFTFLFMVLILGMTIGLFNLTESGKISDSMGVSFEQILRSPAKDWLTYGGDYGSRRYSPLWQINRNNVLNLKLEWVYRVEKEDSNLRVTPLVYDGLMYITNAFEIEALEVVTGKRLWYWRAEQYPEQWMNRGAAILGEEVYFTTKDCVLVALNRKTGQLKWRKKYVSDSSRDYYSCNAAPLALKDRLVVGAGGGAEGTPGFIAALSSSGWQELWRFWTIRADDRQNGGAATWTTGSYDSELNMLYWATGSAWPNYKIKGKSEDDHYFNSVIALDAETGQRKWSYQFTPHDLRHWDANEPLVLVDMWWRGQLRKLLMQANRNGFFYVLDRTDGELLLKKPFVKKMTWTKPGKKGNCPGLIGATNWMSSSYSPVTNLFYVNVLESCGLEPGQHYLRAINPQTGNIQWEFAMGPGSMYAGVATTAGGLVFAGDDAKHFLALDALNGKLLWQFALGQSIFASPIIYAVGDRQYVTIAAGPNIFTFGF